MPSTSTSSFGSSGRSNHDSTAFYNSKLYDQPQPLVSDAVNALPDEHKNKIFLGSSEQMTQIPDQSIHLMITSPPYNAKKEYDADLSLKEYLDLLGNVFTETYRVLVNGGRACVNLANIGRKPYIPHSDYTSRLMIDIGFQMRGEIIWDKGASAGSSCAWGSFASASNPVLRDVHEYILVFSKGEFGRTKQTNSIKKEQFLEWTKSIWRMNTVSAKRIGHPAPFPVELPYRLIEMYSFKEDIVLDPFMGSGQTALAAIKSGRAYVGYDTSEEYVALAEKRIGEVVEKAKEVGQVNDICL